MVLQLSRTTLTAGDPDRNYALVWSVDAGLGLAYKLGQTPVPRQTLLAGEDDEGYEPFYGVLRVPDGTPPGRYVVDVGRGPEATVQVAPSPVWKPAPVVQSGTGKSAETVQTALNAGHNYVTFAPGIHTFDRTVTVPGVATFDAYGAVLARQMANPVGDKFPLFDLSNAPGCGFYGLNVFYDQPSSVLWANPTIIPGTVLANCRFRGCNLGFYLRDALVRDCLFENAGAGVAPAGLWLRVTFSGRGLQDPFDFWANVGPLAMMECVFRGTRRGPCFNAGHGPIADGLYVGTQLADINATPNGCESFLCESGTWDRNMVFRTRATGCLGAVLQLPGGGAGNLVNDLYVDGGVGINFCEPGPVTGTTVRQFELRNGAGIYCPVGSGNLFQDGSVVQWAPGRGAESFQNGSPGLLGRTASCVSADPSNVLQRVNLWPADGWVGQTGFAAAE
jgi:hypothetical protein